MKRLRKWVRWLLNKNELEAQILWMQIIHQDLENISRILLAAGQEAATDDGRVKPLGPVKLYIMPRPRG